MPCERKRTKDVRAAERRRRTSRTQADPFQRRFGQADHRILEPVEWHL